MPKEEEAVEKANKTKRKVNKKKKKGAKKATMPALVDEEESDDDDSDSEEPSPMKPPGRVARAELAGGGAIPKRSLTDKINEMDQAGREEFQTQMQNSFLAIAAIRRQCSPSMQSVQ